MGGKGHDLGRCLLEMALLEGVLQWEVLHVACGIPLSTICSVSLQALEEDLNQKKREQEMFFKLSEEAEYSVPTTPSKATKFFPYSSADAS